MFVSFQDSRLFVNFQDSRLFVSFQDSRLFVNFQNSSLFLLLALGEDDAEGLGVSGKGRVLRRAWTHELLRAVLARNDPPAHFGLRVLVRARASHFIQARLREPSRGHSQAAVGRVEGGSSVGGVGEFSNQ